MNLTNDQKYLAEKISMIECTGATENIPYVANHWVTPSGLVANIEDFPQSTIGDLIAWSVFQSDMILHKLTAQQRGGSK